MRATWSFFFLFAVTFAHAQELWVGTYFGDSVRRYDLSSGAFIGQLDESHLDGPLGMTLGSDGTVSVASEQTGSVERFDKSGRWLGRFCEAPGATAVTFDAAGLAYVAEFDRDAIEQFSASGQSLGLFVPGGSNGLDGPDLGTTIGPDGDLYVPSFYGGDVLRYDGRTGEPKGKLVDGRATGLTQPRQIIWRDGLVYVSSDNGNKVLRFRQDGTLFDTFVKPGNGLNGAVGMTFYGDSLYLVSWRNSRVLRYSAKDGSYEGAFVTSGLNGPVSLLVVPEPKSLTFFGCALGAILSRGWIRGHARKH